jgi:hypothetical protein
MKNIVSNIISIVLVLCSTVYLPVHGQVAKDTTTAVSKRTRYMTGIQYAGSIGFGSVGVGLINKKQTLTHELFYGHTPEVYGGSTNKITYKLTLYPLTVPVSKQVEWKVINPGLFLARNVGEGFSLLPSFQKYPRGYYWWSPALRVHLSLSTACTYMIHPPSGKKLMLYFETNTNERYITTFFSANNYRGGLSFWEIWQLGTGIKFIF